MLTDLKKTAAAIPVYVWPLLFLAVVVLPVWALLSGVQERPGEQYKPSGGPDDPRASVTPNDQVAAALQQHAENLVAVFGAVPR